MTDHHHIAADLDGGGIVTEPAQRRPVAEAACNAWNRPHGVAAFVAGSPVIEVMLEEATLVGG